MKRHRRTLLLIAVMAMVCVSVGGSAIYILYRSAVSKQSAHLLQMVDRQAELIAVIVRSTEAGERADTKPTLEHDVLLAIADTHRGGQDIGETGECLLARRAPGAIEFLTAPRFATSTGTHTVPWDSDRAEPMRRAISGTRGVGVAWDYRGELVLAAYEPVAELGWGIVAKIDLAEVRRPFSRAALIVGGAGFLAILVGAALFLFITNPLIERVARSEALNRNIVEFAADGIVTIDARGTVKTFNESAEKIFGYTADEVIGQNVTVLMPPDLEGLHDLYIRRFLKTGEKHIIGTGRDVVGRRKDGSPVPLHLAVSEMQVGARRMFTGILNDRSAQKKAEDELREAKEAAEAASVAKTRFLSLLSHEFRTPLNSIIGFTDLLGQKLYGPLNEKQREYVQLVGDSGKHLLGMINDLLDIAKLDAKFAELNPEWLRLEELVVIPLQSIKSQLLKKAVTVETSIENGADVVQVDRRKCNQILLNLLSNAIKFSAPGGTIRVSTSLEPDTGIRISVTDMGPGIPVEDQGRIFDEFYQVNQARDSNLGGTGIGLALTRRLVEVQGGQITVESAPETGSTFHVTIPQDISDDGVGAAPEATPGGIVHTGANGNKPEWRVLIAEDDDSSLQLLRDLLEADGHDVAVARNGREAVEVAQSYQPQVMLFDVRMPEMDGIEATARLRALPEFAGTPIIVITADVNGDTVARCEAAGCTGHVSKPIRTEELLALLQRTVSSLDEARNQV